MCDTLKNSVKKSLSNVRGFTIVELSIVLIVIGILIVPALQIWSQWNKQQVVTRTDTAMNQTQRALNNFLSSYGYYPCPARANAVPGDADYGRESKTAGVCTAVANGVWQVNSSNAANADVVANPEVYVGSIPFRDMNMPERFAYDGHNNRILYAVTGLLTDDSTFQIDDGGISVVRYDDSITADVSALEAADTAHFFIFTSGDNHAGAIDRSGSVIDACPAAPAFTNENCDWQSGGDAVFRVGTSRGNFDDTGFYVTNDNAAEWRYASDASTDINLRVATKFTVGATQATDVDAGIGYADLQVVDGADPGNLRAEGNFLSTRICNEAGTNCFFPEAIGGLTPAEGLECPAGEYMVAVEGGGIRCRPEVWFNCPSGEYFSGFNASGEIICSGPPPATCPPQALTAACGDTRTPAAFLDAGQYYAYVYSGTCHMIDDLTPADVAALDAAADDVAARAYVEGSGGLNDQARTASDCGDTSNTVSYPGNLGGLTRSTFECNAGVWNTTPIRTIERRHYSNNSFGNAAPTSGGDPADMTGAAYNPADPMSSDPNNNNHYHDCWCREDYRVETRSCGGGLSGLEFRVVKHRCPHTRNHSSERVQVYGWNDNGCGCVPNPTPQQEHVDSCRDYFGYTGQPGDLSGALGVSGDVTRSYTVTCPSGPTGPAVRAYITPSDPSHIGSNGPYDNISQCRCPVQPSPDISQDPCPATQVNNHMYGGNSYPNTENIYESLWTCPGGAAPVQPITSAADAGHYVVPPTLRSTEACVCDTTIPDQVHVIPCNSHPDFGPAYGGSGVRHDLPWDCATSSHEAPSPSNETSRDCTLCTRKTGTPLYGGALQTNGAGGMQGCTSCSDPAQPTCSVAVTGGHLHYSGCACAP